MALIPIKKAGALLLMVLLFSSAIAAMPSDSVYQLNAALTDQNGSKSQWADAPKGPRIVSMFYSNCDYVCPLLFEAIRNVEAALPPEQRARLSVGLLSLDPERDTPAVLKKIAIQHDVDQTRWRVYRAKPADVRKIAALLNVQYRKLSSGEFNHSTVMVLLDWQGRVIARTEKISGTDTAFLEAVRKATLAS
jgi:protein SCO1